MRHLTTSELVALADTPEAIEELARRGRDPKGRKVTATGSKAVQIERAAQAALDAYESRFGSTIVETRHNLTGPIDDEMVALREALKGTT